MQQLACSLEPEMFTTGRGHHGSMGCALSLQLAVQDHNLEPESSEDYRHAEQTRLH